MVQMHSYLVTNAKTELRFLNDGTTIEEFDLSASLLADNNSFNDQDFDEESVIIDHGNPNFDIDELINSFESI